MGYIEGENRRQNLLFPESLEEYIEKENPVRLFDAFVESLDFKNLEFERETPKAEGRPGYNPRDLMKLYIYSYYYRLRSSLQIARECKVNLEIMWLIGKLRPDFRTIANFRKDNKNAIRKVFKEFNRFCYKMDLFSHDGISIDGSKFKAVNAKDNNFTQSKLDDRQTEEIGKKLSVYRKRKEKYENMQKRMTDENLCQISLTDSESKLMKMNEGFGLCYNTQTAVDTGSHLIADYEVTDRATDHGQITKLAKKVKEDFREFQEAEGNNPHEIIETIADKGYQDTKNMEEALCEGIIPNVTPRDGTTCEIEYDYEPSEITEEIRLGAEPEDLRKCLKAGVVPEVYNGILKAEGIKGRTHYEYESTDAGIARTDTERMILKAREGYFVRNAEENLVFCPQGKALRQKSIKKNGDIRY